VRFRQFLKLGILNAFGVARQVAPADGILLTFDDGPHPEVTPAVLDLLAKYSIKAVFFIVGNRISMAPRLLPRILAEGHVIGNHTYRHPLDGTPALPAYLRDVRECQAILHQHTGVSPTLFRPPLGSLTLASLLAPRLAGLRTMLWSVDVDDWRLRTKPAAVNAGHRLAHAAKPGDIVLLHDDNPCVIDVLETALPVLNSRYEMDVSCLSRYPATSRDGWSWMSVCF
jgi:peptidoglycan/xylan/chitin deacetylase (PgdA/CDA1 family)